MGQRLTIDVKKDNEVVAALYFHWSAYTVSAVMTAQSIVEYLNDEDSDTKDLELVLRLIRFVEENGGGIDGGEGSEEWEYITAKYPNVTFKRDDINRNHGLIAISPNGIEGIHSWSEGEIVIDLDAETISDSVFFIYEDIDELNEERQEWMDDDYEPISMDDIPELDYDPGECSFEDLPDFVANLEGNNNCYARYGDIIYGFIQ